ncbi:MAG TPA: hypothetical protein DCX32_00350 [Candidatus Moranbacteria bacterium]|nr:MAG: hypothetical protein UW87_C0005G0006 [Candidatus Moranbacteria bacterium GW2011_GWC2_45_10]KKT95298.1 MAG: hypothetical protein UW95_C0002G0041 [Parcubacteria group bacterium GW2011_GWC1_45_14]HAV10988.1 hypothetical protein [Candidatus Moranbacteria bacterium]
MEGKIKCITKGVSELNMEIKKKVAGYITAGFGVVAGLAWNDAIRTFIEKYFPQDSNTIVAKFIYAFFITLFLVIVSIYLVRLLRVEEIKKEKEQE